MLNSGHNASDASSRLVGLRDADETIGLTTEGPPKLSAPSAPKVYALPTEWEQHKQKIRQLYLDENKPLREVMAIMDRDHGHFGSRTSIKQYKNKLREWGFDTKYKRHQTSRKRINKRPRRQSAVADRWLASLATDHYSQASDARGADDRLFQATNIPFQASNAGSAYTHLFEAPDASDAVDYIFQAPDAQDADDQAADVGHANTPNTARQVSADNEENWQLSLPFRQSLALSQAVGVRSGRSATPPISIAERIFSLAQRHIETSFTYGVWKVDSSNVCTSMTCTKEEMDLPETYFDLVRSAVLLFEQGSTIEGHHVVSKAFALVKPILKSGNVRALNFFWTSLVFLVQFDQVNIVVSLIRYIYEMAKVVLHPEHPVVHMFKLLTQIDVLELESLVHNTWQITADAFQKELPKLDPEYVRHQCDLIFRMYGTRDAATAERRLRQLLKDCEDTARTLEVSHLTVLNALGYNFMNSKDWVQAVNIGQKLEERARLAQDINLLVYQIGGMEIQARAFKELKLIMPAVKCLKQATPLIAEQWGSNDPWRIELMVLQQKWLRENGEIKAADDLKAEIKSITERIDTD
ncbi:hypothetical protein Aspvir_002912 [Aspergillus viridinutans]|uniref:Clr5 domain-containing protein n=1 Tax=Aspergillus viridinutans TaxID=75553 RepID=A0A9P3CBM9_ASPVI|nr:uncharacterized protein Aspvir_002912 [Aspergillus viridinutans]GIK07254.1 hypothetical protein Aspvir_002912 [Aspergillus viridinutans]